MPETIDQLRALAALERAARKELERALLGAPSGVKCFFCGQVMPNGIEEVRNHLQSCPKHPLNQRVAELEADQKRLLEEVRRLNAALDAAKKERDTQMTLFEAGKS